jgi:lipopolysaccharide transport system permease protein
LAVLKHLLRYFWPVHHADLIIQLTGRDIQARYRQSWLGLTWLVLAPLLMLAIYTLVFRHVFQVRWSPPGEGNLAFALRLYTGLAVFNFFAECTNRAPHLVLEQPSLVKKVVFPLEVLPWVSVLAATAQLLTAGAVLVLLRWLGMGSVPWSVLALPLIWLPLVPLCLGLGWGLSALGPFIRDVGQVIGMLVSVLVFISPVFFPVEALPARLQDWMWLNPLAPIMTQTRMVLLDGLWPDAHSWLQSTLSCLVVAAAGAGIFQRLRRGFADVI